MTWKLYIHQARRWVLLAILPGLVLGALFYWNTNRQPRTYAATATLYVQQAAAGAGGPSAVVDVGVSTLLAPTYASLINQPEVYNAANRLMAPRWPGYQITGITTDQPAQTQLIQVTAADTNPQRAADAADALARAFVARIAQLEKKRFAPDEKSMVAQLTQAQANVQQQANLIKTYHGDPAGLVTQKATLATYQNAENQAFIGLQQFRVQRDATLNGVSVASLAQVPATPTGPHPARSGLLAAFVFTLIFAGGIFLYDYFDDTMRNPDEVEELAGAPILGTVELFDAKGKGKQLITANDPRSHMSEAYRLIRTNILFTNVDHPPRTLVITSASPKEGKSTTSSNLARVFADGGYEVSLIDADLRRPSLHRIFQVESREGLTNMLLMGGNLNGHGVQQTDHPNLDLIVAGPIPPNPADLLSSQRMHQVLAHTSSRSRMTLIDAPPILPVTDAAILSTMADGVVLVVDPSHTKRRDLRRARESIEGVGGKIIGVVINKVSPKGAGYHYYYHQYGYRYTYGYGPQNVGRGGKGKSAVTADDPKVLSRKG